jgi:hypothetical protein
MSMVFWDPAAADEATAAGGAPDIRVPHAPQNAKPGVTIRPQLGQVCPSMDVWGVCWPADDAAVAVAVAADSRTGARSAAVVGGAATDGGGVKDPMTPEAVAPPFCNDGAAAVDAGIFGESFQGIPPFCRGMLDAVDPPSVGGGVGSLPAPCPIAVLSGGSMVRAVSSGAGSRAGALGAGLISLPQPRQNL